MARRLRMKCLNCGHRNWVPKLYAEIPDLVKIDSNWHIHAERHGVRLVEMDAKPDTRALSTFSPF